MKFVTQQAEKYLGQDFQWYLDAEIYLNKELSKLNIKTSQSSP